VITSRPHRWIGPRGQVLTDSVFCALAQQQADCTKGFEPVYTRAAVEAAIETERKRFAGRCRAQGCDLLARMVCIGEPGQAK
jgi:hypothetical protein